MMFDPFLVLQNFRGDIVWSIVNPPFAAYPRLMGTLGLNCIGCSFIPNSAVSFFSAAVKVEAELSYWEHEDFRQKGE